MDFVCDEEDSALSFFREPQAEAQHVSGSGAQAEGNEQLHQWAKEAPGSGDIAVMCGECRESIDFTPPPGINLVPTTVQLRRHAHNRPRLNVPRTRQTWYNYLASEWLNNRGLTQFPVYGLSAVRLSSHSGFLRFGLLIYSTTTFHLNLFGDSSCYASYGSE